MSFIDLDNIYKEIQFNINKCSHLVTNEVTDSLDVDVANSIHFGLQKILDQLLSSSTSSLTTKKNDEKTRILISLTQLRITYTAVEIIWCYIWNSFFLKNINFNLTENHPNSLLLNHMTMKKLSLKFALMTPCIEDIENGTMLNRNLPRLLISLTYFGYQYSDDSIQKRYREILQSICLGPYKYVIVSNLSILSRGPNWMKHAGSTLLSSIILSEDGLQAVLIGYLEGLSDDPQNSTAQEMVAKLIISIPSGMKREVYLSNVCNQVVDLIIRSYQTKDKVLTRVCMLIIIRISSVDPDLCMSKVIKFFLDPLCRLQSFTECSSSGTIITSEQMVFCITILHDFLYLVPISPSLLAVLKSINIISHISVLILNYPTRRDENKQSKTNSFYETKKLLEESWLVLIQRMDPQLCACVLFNAVTYQPSWIIDVDSEGSIKVMFKASTSQDKQLSEPILHIPASSKSKSLNTSNILSLSDTLYAIKSKDSLDLNNDINSLNKDIDEESDLAQILQMAADLTSTSSGNDTISTILNDSQRIQVLVDLMIQTSYETEPNQLQKISDSLVALMNKLFLLTLEVFLGTYKNMQDFFCDELQMKSTAGIFILILQNSVPIDNLLSDGCSVLNLVYSFIQSHAESFVLDYSPGTGDESIKIKESPSPFSVVIPNQNDHINSNSNSDGTDSGKYETMECLLGLLSDIIQLGSDVRSPEEEYVLHQLQEQLLMISLRDPNEEISQSANQLVMLLLKRKCRDLKSSGDSTLQNGNSSSSLSHCIDKFKQEYFTSDSPSLRAYGVQYVSDTFQKELKLGSGIISTLIYKKVLDCYFDALADIESFVFLCAIRAIRLVFEVPIYRRPLLQNLLNIFSTGSCKKMAMSDSTVSTSATNRSKNILSLRSRAMIAETLVDMLKRSGDMGSILSGEIISVCLPLARQRISQEQYNLLDTHVDLSRFRVNTYVNNEENQQTMKSPDETNQTDENLTNQSLVKAAEAADALLFRQSAVSLLSEAFSRGGWNSVRFLSDVVDLAVGILTFETSLFCKYGLSDQANIIIRRCAAFLLSHAVTYLSDQLTSYQESSSLMRIQQALQLANEDRDDVVKFHGSSGLALIASITVNKVLETDQRWDILTNNPKIQILN